MEKLFRKAIIQFFKENIPKSFPDFKARKLDKEEKSRYDVAPITAFASKQQGHEYFMVFLPHRSSVYVELGWKETASAQFPIFWVGFDEAVDKIRQGAFDWPTGEFAIRLFKLCRDRNEGRMEKFWDMYSPAMWDKGKESYNEFMKNWSRSFDAIDISMEWARNGGITEEYAQGQAALIGNDIMGCLRDYGIPFLEEAMRHHAIEK